MWDPGCSEALRCFSDSSCLWPAVLTSIWTWSPGWSSRRRSSSAAGWAAPAWRRCGAPRRLSTGSYRPGSWPCWSRAASHETRSVCSEERTGLVRDLLRSSITVSCSNKLCNKLLHMFAALLLLFILYFERFQTGSFLLNHKGPSGGDNCARKKHRVAQRAAKIQENPRHTSLLWDKLVFSTLSLFQTFSLLTLLVRSQKTEINKQEALREHKLHQGSF